MSILHRSLLGGYVRNLLYTMAGALILFTLVDLLEHIGAFVDNEATMGQVLRYYAYKAAWIVDTVLPIALLMATLFTIGGMARYLELTALFAAGWSLMRVARPLLVFAAVMTLFSLAWREYILPESNVQLNRVWEVEIHGRPDSIRPTQHIAVTGADGRLYYARRFDPNTSQITGLKVVSRNGPRVAERIDAQRAEWDGRHWTLHQGVRRTFTADGETVTNFERLTAADLSVDPRSFYRDRIRQEDMSIRQLREHIGLLRQTGGDPTSAMVDVQFNLAFPLVNFIVVLLGVILASGPRKTTIASGFGLTVLISFGYYLFINFGRSLGHAGTLPPVAAAWSGNLFYAFLAAVLFARARR